jgi:hypothetical protein
MPPRPWKILAALIVTTGGASAQDGPDCFSSATSFNACAYARNLAAEQAPSLPKTISSEMTVSSIAAVGRRITFYLTWARTKAQVEREMVGQTIVEVAARAQATTVNSVCSQAPTAAFIRLGGEIQYLYKTTDGFVVLSPTVTTCPR